MARKLSILLFCFFGVVACESRNYPHLDEQRNNAVNIAFGSCLRQWQSQPVWQGVAAVNPHAFVFLGDNTYNGVGPYRKMPQPQRIGQAYADLANSEDFQAFRQWADVSNTKIYATWDDHDYGVNDGGVEYPFKLQSKQYFKDFFAIEETAAGSGSAGIYDSHFITINDAEVQLILLDTRSFRSPLKKSADTSCKTQTIANADKGATLLGPQQWKWLETELNRPADVRIIASSIQVIPEQHCFEKWANFPNERSRLFELIAKARAGGVIFISGDRHLAEISLLEDSSAGYPLYEVTASGLNSSMGVISQGSLEDNDYRATEKNMLDDNFGSVTILTVDDEFIVNLQLHDVNGQVRQQIAVPLEEISL